MYSIVSPALTGTRRGHQDGASGRQAGTGHRPLCLVANVDPADNEASLRCLLRAGYKPSHGAKLAQRIEASWGPDDVSPELELIEPGAKDPTTGLLLQVLGGSLNSIHQILGRTAVLGRLHFGEGHGL